MEHAGAYKYVLVVLNTKLLVRLLEDLRDTGWL